MAKIVFSIALVIFLSGCSGLREKADNAMINGEYETALDLYRRAVELHPNDEKARSGFRRAKRAWISHKLIEVRLLRLGNNFGDSEDLLIEVLEKENSWQIFPTGAVFATQKEEIELYAKRILSKIAKELKNNNPLAAQIYFNRSEFILEKALDKNLAKMRSKIFDLAKIFCRDGYKSLKNNEYYTYIWLKKTCRIWEIPVAKKPLNNSVALFNDIKVRANIKGMQADLSEQLEKFISTAFLKSKWHDPKGTAILDLEVTGRFLSKDLEVPTQLEKAFYIQVPYETTYQRIKQPEDKSTAGAILSVLSLFTDGNERVVDNGDGTETVHKTEYRKERRIKTFDAVEMSSAKMFKGRIHANLDKRIFSTEVIGNYNKIRYRHNKNFPDIGLYPSAPRFITDSEWVESMSDEWVSSITTELQSHWIKNFCKNNEVSNLSTREKMFRCAYQIDVVPPEKLAQFFNKTWGITYNDWYNLSHRRTAVDKI